MCKICSDQIHGTAKRKGHTRHPWTAAVDSGPPLCALLGHANQPLALVCQCDGSLICMFCNTHGDHQGHKTRLLSAVAAELKDQLRRNAVQVDEEVRLAQQAIVWAADLAEKINGAKGSKAIARRQIVDQFSAWRLELDTKEQELLEMVDKKAKEKTVRVNGMLEELAVFEKAALAALGEASEVLGSSNDRLVAAQTNKAVKRLDESLGLAREYTADVSEEIAVQFAALTWIGTCCTIGTPAGGKRADVTKPKKSMGAMRTKYGFDVGRGVKKVLLSGGEKLKSCEMFDLQTGRFNAVADMPVVRSHHSSVMLADGNVLLSGGDGLKSCVIHNPQTNAYSAVADMSVVRLNHCSAAMLDGRVLIASGKGLKSCEVYHPQNNAFSVAADLSFVRGQAAAATLLDGRVLVVGGYDNAGNWLASGDLYDPKNGKFDPSPHLNFKRNGCGAIILPDGRVLVFGGCDGPSFLQSCEIFDPRANRFTAAASMTEKRHIARGVLLEDGTILIIGGQNSGKWLTSSEIYDPATNTFKAGPAMTATRSHFSASGCF